MATKSKSRTSKNNLSKKAHVPVWAIVLGLVVLVGLGAFFVYRSFAFGGLTGNNVYCVSGICHATPYGQNLGNQSGKYCTYHPGKRFRYFCE